MQQVQLRWEKMVKGVISLNSRSSKAFALFCVELLTPFYVDFCRINKWPHETMFQKHIEDAWNTLLTGKDQSSGIGVENLIPDVDDFEDTRASLACNAGLTLMLAIETPPNVQHCIQYVWNSVDILAGEQAPLDITNSKFDQFIENSSIMLKYLSLVETGFEISSVVIGKSEVESLKEIASPHHNSGKK